MIVREEQQQMILVQPPQPVPEEQSFLWVDQWMWSGVILPLAIAWIMYRRKGHKE